MINTRSKKTFIFDFDGTIADTFLYMALISNRICEEFKYDAIDLNELDALKDKTSKEVVRFLQIPVFKIPAILSKGFKEYKKDIQILEPFAGIQEVFLKLNQFGHQMGILSTNTSENIHRFLKNHNLDFFDFIHTNAGIWGKNVSLKRLIKKEGLALDQILYIGDETRDIEAARKLGIKVAAVVWGYNSPQTLQAHQPDYLIRTPEELLALCLKFS